jgi:hypothetical protein
VFETRAGCGSKAACDNQAKNGGRPRKLIDETSRVFRNFSRTFFGPLQPSVRVKALSKKCPGRSREWMDLRPGNPVGSRGDWLVRGDRGAERAGQQHRPRVRIEREFAFVIRAARDRQRAAADGGCQFQAKIPVRHQNEDVRSLNQLLSWTVRRGGLPSSSVVYSVHVADFHGPGMPIQHQSHHVKKFDVSGSVHPDRPSG